MLDKQSIAPHNSVLYIVGKEFLNPEQRRRNDELGENLLTFDWYHLFPKPS